MYFCVLMCAAQLLCVLLCADVCCATETLAQYCTQHTIRFKTVGAMHGAVKSSSRGDQVHFQCLETGAPICYHVSCCVLCVLILWGLFLR